MLAEMYGKATGCTKGKGGGMHLIDPEAGVMGASAVVGTTIANAVGYAYSVKLRRQERGGDELFWRRRERGRRVCRKPQLRRPQEAACHLCL